MKGKIKQVAVVVKDLKSTMHNYWDLLSIGPWDVRHFKPESVHDFYFAGEHITDKFEFICAVCWVGDMEFELIQPIEGPNVYWEFLDKKGEGFHHFKIVIENDDELKAYVDELGEKGLKVTQTGWIDNDVHYYLSSEEKLGFTVEMGNGGKIGPPDYVYPEYLTEEDKKRRRQNYKQIAIVVDDVNTYMQNLWSILEIGPWDVRHFTQDTVRNFQIRGVPVEEAFHFICAVCWVGDVELELIQPIQGPNIYWDHRDTVGIGLHHLKDVMPDAEIETVIDEMEKNGMKVTQTGWIDNDVHYYVDSKEQLKMVMELGNGGKIGAPDYIYPSVSK